MERSRTFFTMALHTTERAHVRAEIHRQAGSRTVREGDIDGVREPRRGEIQAPHLLFHFLLKQLFGGRLWHGTALCTGKEEKRAGKRDAHFKGPGDRAKREWKGGVKGVGVELDQCTPTFHRATFSFAASPRAHATPMQASSSLKYAPPTLYIHFLSISLYAFPCCVSPPPPTPRHVWCSSPIAPRHMCLRVQHRVVTSICVCSWAYSISLRACISRSNLHLRRDTFGTRLSKLKGSFLV